jgi:hypothetical protein
MATAFLDLQHVSIISNIEEKNARAQEVIRRYARDHALMDIGIGVVSLVPGAGIPAIVGAIALQSNVIYKPMAKELAAIYLAETDTYTDQLGEVASVATVALEFAQEFAIEFLSECAFELVTEAGLGGLATLIPIGGAFVAAGLDYLIAQMLTWRVGTMTSIYFQNGGQWIDSRKTTMGIAKEMSGGLAVSVSTLLRTGKALVSRSTVPESRVRVDFNEIPVKVPQVMKSGIKSLLPIIKNIADKLPRTAVRDSLVAMGVSTILVDAALAAYYG